MTSIDDNKTISDWFHTTKYSGSHEKQKLCRASTFKREHCDHQSDIYNDGCDVYRCSSWKYPQYDKELYLWSNRLYKAIEEYDVHIATGIILKYVPFKFWDMESHPLLQ